MMINSPAQVDVSLGVDTRASSPLGPRRSRRFWKSVHEKSPGVHEAHSLGVALSALLGSRHVYRHMGVF